MARPLHVYLVLDTSGSMTGEPIAAVNNGVQLLASTLRQDPVALENTYLSVITFSETATQLIPLTDLSSFMPPTLNASGATSLGAALTALSDAIDSEVKTTTAESKGDLKPLVFIMTDGLPTDNWQDGLNRFKTVKTGTVIACAAGPDADESLLENITPYVVRLDTADASTIGALFKRVSESVLYMDGPIFGSPFHPLTAFSKIPPPPEIHLPA